MTTWSDISKQFSPDPKKVSVEDVLSEGVYDIAFVGEPILHNDEIYTQVYDERRVSAHFLKISDPRLIRYLSSSLTRSDVVNPVFRVQVHLTNSGPVATQITRQPRSLNENVHVGEAFISYKGRFVDLKSLEAAIAQGLWAPEKWSRDRLNEHLNALLEEFPSVLRIRAKGLFS